MKSINKFFPKSKKLPIDKFIGNAMYGKKIGYYSKKISFGKNGDFITSPLISCLFSEMLALWIISFWEHLEKPKIFNIIELGPGNGQMILDLIKVFKKFPNFFLSCNIFLYEKSESLKKIQKNILNKEKINWIESFKKIKKGSVIFLGNEFFDAIPIKQYEKINNILYEKHVKLDNNSKINTFLKKTNLKSIKELKKFNLINKQSFIEYPKQGLEEIDLILDTIKKLKGALLLIDYGYTQQQNIDTLQSIKDQKQNIIFDNVGDADITSLVNFNLLKKYLEKNKLTVNKIVTQEFFLKRMGIIDRMEILSKKMNFKEKSDLYFRVQRLLNPKQMGELFKIICAFKLKNKFSLGFI